MSSSSDEDLSKFTEATDSTLFKNCLFAEAKDKGDGDSSVPAKSSLRYLDGPDENRTDLKVTPGFQKHVASRLMKILDSSLDQNAVFPERTSTPEHDSNGNCTTDQSPKKAEGGIRLFGASAAFLASCNITPPPPTRRRKRGRKAALISSASEDDSSSNEADVSNLSNKDSPSPEKVQKLGVHDEMDLSNRFAACAVSSDWILNGDAVKGWAPRHNIKEPIKGEATPDLIKMASFLTINKKHKKRKKKKHKEEEPPAMEGTGETSATENRKRGKRGGAKKKKYRVSEVIGDENLPDKSYKPPKRKKKRPETADGTEGTEGPVIRVMTEKEKRDNRISRALYKEFKRSICEGNREQVQSNAQVEGNVEVQGHVEVQGNEVEGGVAELEPKKKRRRRKKSLSEMAGIGIDESLNDFLKKMKKKKRRKERENELPMPVLEDEGFDSDPTKTDRTRRQQQKLLRAELKRQKKVEKKKWKNNMEYLSKDLANLMMTPVKED